MVLEGALRIEHLLNQESYSMNWNTRKIMDAPWQKEMGNKRLQPDQVSNGKKGTLLLFRRFVGDDILPSYVGILS